jgi:YVTN family beta-propeller protein
MPPQRFYIIALLFFSINACYSHAPLSQNALTDDGRVVVYLEPMPQEAAKLRFEIDEIVAVRDDGRRIALLLSVREIISADLVGRQTRLATGWLPEGAYTGISIRFRRAILQGEEGESSLLVPEEPVWLSHPFSATRRKASALFLSFNPTGALSDGVRFTPGFSMDDPGTIISNLAGYVSSPQTNTITVFNKKSMRVVDILAVGREPKGLALDQKSGRLYVALCGDDAIAVIDLLSGRAVDLMKLNYQDRPTGLALTPDGRTLVCVNQGSNTASIIDARSLFEITRIRVGEGPVSVVMAPYGLRAYVMNVLSNSVSAIDLSQRQLAATVAVEGSPLRGAFSRNGDGLFVISRDSPNLSVINPSTFIVTAKLFIGVQPGAIRVDHRTDTIIVGKQSGGLIDFIDPFSQMRIDTMTVDGHVADMAIDTEEYSLLVVLSGEQKVQKVNLTSKQITAAIEVDGEAYSVVVMGGY